MLAMARKSPTALTSNCSSTARYSRYWSVIFGDGNIDDLHLVLAHQVEKQVQRTAEHVQIDAKIHRLIIPAHTAVTFDCQGLPA